MNEQAQTAEHPDPDRWWQRKWKMAIFGACVAAVSLLAGFLLIPAGQGEAAAPYTQMGLWFGFGVILTFVLPAAAENITDKIGGGKR